MGNRYLTFFGFTRYAKESERMDIQFKNTRYEPTPEFVAQVTKKIEALARFVDESTSTAHATIELEQAIGGKQQGDIWRAELMIVQEGVRFRAESTKAKLDHAVTTVVRDVGQELRRAKGKGQTLFKKGGAQVKAFLRGFGK